MRVACSLQTSPKSLRVLGVAAVKHLYVSAAFVHRGPSTPNPLHLGAMARHLEEVVAGAMTRSAMAAYDRIDRSSVVGGVKVEDAIAQVEEELETWQCSNYTHITRVLGMTGVTIDLETIFSKPVQDQPVPTAVVCVYFHLDTDSGALSYSFEQESVQHKAGGHGLAPGKFELWLDRIIGDKMQVRQLNDLATPYEESRLVPPPMVSEALDDGQGAEDLEPGADEAGGEAGAAGAEPERLPLTILLANIFDAADEEDEYELTHKEVADLLYATPLGLEDWDIKLLLTTATELDTGRIEYKPFVAAAPQLIEALLKRRAAFMQRHVSKVTIGMEADLPRIIPPRETPAHAPRTPAPVKAPLQRGEDPYKTPKAPRRMPF